MYSNDVLEIDSVIANNRTSVLTFQSSHMQPTRSGPPVWGLGEELRTPYRKKKKGLLRNVTQGLGFERIFRNDIGEGKLI
jgi:hypothetical protein